MASIILLSSKKYYSHTIFEPSVRFNWMILFVLLTYYYLLMAKKDWALTWLLFSSKFQKWPWQSTQGFTFLSWNHWHLTNIMVEHNPLEESTSFILMKHFVFFITFAKIADWIDPEVNLKSQKNVRKWSYENFFCTFFNDNKILNSIISEWFFELFASLKRSKSKCK